MDLCIHSIEKELCHFCNGGFFREQKIHRKNLQATKEIKEAKRKYDEVKDKFRNHCEDWTEDEYQILYENLRGITNIRSKLFRKVVYKVAIELERTRKSIIWHYKHMFILEDNLKAGKRLLAFKREKGLCCA